MILFEELYDEHGEVIENNLPEVQWFDLWHNQVNFLEEEHPFPTPAVFASYRTLGDPEDIGNKVQNMKVQVDFYLFYETFADTYRGARNKDTALDFLKILSAIYKQFHGSSGKNYSEMRHIATAPIDTGNAGNLYRISFTCQILNYHALKEYVDSQQDADIDVSAITYDVQ